MAFLKCFKSIIVGVMALAASNGFSYPDKQIGT